MHVFFSHSFAVFLFPVFVVDLQAKANLELKKKKVKDAYVEVFVRDIYIYIYIYWCFFIKKMTYD